MKKWTCSGTIISNFQQIWTHLGSFNPLTRFGDSLDPIFAWAHFHKRYMKRIRIDPSSYAPSSFDIYLHFSAFQLHKKASSISDTGQTTKSIVFYLFFYHPRLDETSISNIFVHGWSISMGLFFNKRIKYLFSESD